MANAPKGGMGYALAALIIVLLYFKLSYTKSKVVKAKSRVRKLERRNVADGQDALLARKVVKKVAIKKRISNRDKEVEQLYAELEKMGIDVNDTSTALDESTARLRRRPKGRGTD